MDKKIAEDKADTNKTELVDPISPASDIAAIPPTIITQNNFQEITNPVVIQESFEETNINSSDLKKYKILDDVYKYQSKSKLGGIPRWAKIIISIVLILIAIGVVVGAAFAIYYVVIGLPG